MNRWGRGDPGLIFLTVLVIAVVGQRHGVHRAGEARHGWGRWPGARGMQLAELASEVRGTEAAVRLHAHTAVVTDQGTQDWGEREASSDLNVIFKVSPRCKSLRLELSCVTPNNPGHLHWLGPVILPFAIVPPPGSGSQALPLFIHSQVTPPFLSSPTLRPGPGVPAPPRQRCPRPLVQPGPLSLFPKQLAPPI